MSKWNSVNKTSGFMSLFLRFRGFNIMSDLNCTCFNNIHGGNAVTSPIIVNSFSPSLLYQSISMDTCIPGYLISMDTFLWNYVLITYSWDFLSLRNRAALAYRIRSLNGRFTDLLSVLLWFCHYSIIYTSNIWIKNVNYSSSGNFVCWPISAILSIFLSTTPLPCYGV